MKNFIIFLCTLFILSGLQGQQLPLNPNVKTGRLQNGLTYFILQNKRPEKRMELRIAVNAGSTAENDDQLGIAHFVEHMAFNGTRHFKKSELVDYLESIGTKFGPHLNAYTSFDETVYMMRVPTDSATQVNNAFLILEDWAGGLTFDTTEINKERGVVIEEWRLGQGAFERMRNKYWPVIFKDSRYEIRLPIGKKEILETVPYEKLIAFYKDWYRPDNMAVIAIGDFDVNEIEKKIIEHFSNLSNPQNERPVQSWDVPDQPRLDIAKVTDKEAPYTMIEMSYRHPKQDTKNEQDYRRNMVQNLYNGLINSRLEELINKPDAPFNYAYTYYGNMVRNKSNYTSFAIVNDKKIMKGLEALVQENERVRRYGYTPGEFDRQKKELMRNIEKQYAERDKTESANFTYELVSYFLEGNPSEGAEKAYELHKKYLDGISIEEVNALAKEWILPEGRNAFVVIQAPEKAGVVLPDDDAIRKIFNDAEKLVLKPYEDKTSNVPLLAKKPLAGKIISTKTDTLFKYTELKLSNGATVVYKKTNFKNDDIQFRAHSWGGSGLYSVRDDMSIGMAGGIMEKSGLGSFDKTQLDKSLKGKTVSIYPYITEISENIYGNSSPNDLETLMQMVYLYFTSPRNDKSGYEAFMEQQKGFIENRKLDPENAFYDTVQVTMSGYHERRRPWTIELLNEVKHDRAFTVFKERFANAGDFTFYFVGNIDEAKIKKFACNYIASIPSKNIKETWKDVNVQTPKGIVKKTVKRGIEPKSSVSFEFTGPATFSAKENMDMKALASLLSIKLRESLREEKGGTYGVDCYGHISRIPKIEYDLSISFGCAPANVDSLTQAALDVIEKVKKSGCDDKDLTKLKETFRRERETNLRENNWWINNLMSKYNMKDNLPSQKELDDYLAKLNSEDLKVAAIKYLKLDNYGYFVLIPE